MAEALRSDSMTVNSLLCQKEFKNSDVAALARAKGVKVQFADKQALDRESADGRHQGFIADVTEFRYCEVEDVLAASEKPFIVVLDGINDPHNFGSIIRVCECAGVDGIIIGKQTGGCHRYGGKMLCGSRRPRAYSARHQRQQRHKIFAA